MLICETTQNIYTTYILVTMRNTIIVALCMGHFSEEESKESCYPELFNQFTFLQMALSLLFLNLDTEICL